MASLKFDCSETVFRFKFNIDRLKLGEIETPEIKLSKLHWKIKLNKRSTSESNNDTDEIDVSLVCEPSSDINKTIWSCNALAVFKLVSSKQEIVKTLSNKEFNSKHLSHTINGFVPWNELLNVENQYMNENEVSLDIEIQTNPLCCIKAMAMEQSSTKLRLIVESVSKLGNVYSPEVILRGIRFKIQTRKEDEHFAVYLWAVEDDMDMNWCWEVFYSFKLLSFNNKVEPIDCKTTSDIFRYGCPSWGYGRLIKWSEFIDPKKRFVRNDTAIIEIEFTVKPPKPLWECKKDTTYTKTVRTLECSICFENFCEREVCATKCGHLFCTECITRSIEDRQKCPMCNADAAIDDL
ncbi:uncharacterized protein LOC116346777, partial [Contarinia nasturtii]|uniref:uncharacterized protein LOC116346777 n=1 Tax=Contarinia nasturtii TaxID=265458 RepID=UPI0012D41095